MHPRNETETKRETKPGRAVSVKNDDDDVCGFEL